MSREICGQRTYSEETNMYYDHSSNIKKPRQYRGNHTKEFVMRQSKLCRVVGGYVEKTQIVVTAKSEGSHSGVA
jgi:hypothetical protein